MTSLPEPSAGVTCRLQLLPDPALLALTDPYDPLLRMDLPFLSDASLYGGRYYLYFGPVPALLVLVVKFFIPGIIGDQTLVFVFTCGVFLLESLFLLKIRRRFFSGVPPWMVGACILVVGLISPFGWILGSRQAVHDAAISAGQFFLLAGLYAAFAAFDRALISKSMALLAGILWALALGSRITQVVPIAFLILLVVTGILWKYNRAGLRAGSAPAMLAVRVAPHARDSRAGMVQLGAIRLGVRDRHQVSAGASVYPEVPA